ncbi:MAG TPA: hypothetical protein PLJ58_01535 [bacterium]|nr:hypothetical protein [bacterium]
MISSAVGVIQSIFYSACFTVLFIFFFGWSIFFFVFIGFLVMIGLFIAMEVWTELRLPKVEDPRRADIVSVLVAIFSRPVVELLGE